MGTRSWSGGNPVVSGNPKIEEGMGGWELNFSLSLSVSLSLLLLNARWQLGLPVLNTHGAPSVSKNRLNWFKTTQKTHPKNPTHLNYFARMRKPILKPAGYKRTFRRAQPHKRTKPPSTQAHSAGAVLLAKNNAQISIPQK